MILESSYIKKSETFEASFESMFFNYHPVNDPTISQAR